MKTILVLSSHPDFADIIRASLEPEQYRVIHRLNVDEAEPLLEHDLAGACILDVNLMGVEGVWVIERLRRHAAKKPIIAYTSDNQAEWEEKAFLHGVTHVLTKPVRRQLLNSLLERLWNVPASPPPRPVPPAPAPSTRLFSLPVESPASGRSINAAQTLDVLRDFSSILTHSLDAGAMLKQFLQFLREILSVNRAAIFLNRPCTPLAKTPSPADSRRLRAVSAIGISSGLLENFELSLDSGLGAQLGQTRADPPPGQRRSLRGRRIAKGI